MYLGRFVEEPPDVRTESHDLRIRISVVPDPFVRRVGHLARNSLVRVRKVLRDIPGGSGHGE